MKFRKLMRNRLGPAIFFSILLLASAGAAYLAIGAGANVNCIAGTCYSTNGNADTASPYDSTTVFTGDNDTASIECAGGTYSGGGGNDTFYLHDPQTAPVAAVTISGEGGDDVILDGSMVNNNTFNGGDGNDFIAGGAETDWIYGGTGDDLLAGGDGGDWIVGGPGNDIISGGPGCYATPPGGGSDAHIGDDIFIIQAGDLPDIPGWVELWLCKGADIALLFGMNFEGAFVVTIAGFDDDGDGAIDEDDPKLPAGDGVDNDGDGLIDEDLPGRAVVDPKTGGRYLFLAIGAGDTCTVIGTD